MFELVSLFKEEFVVKGGDRPPSDECQEISVAHIDVDAPDSKDVSDEWFNFVRDEGDEMWLDRRTGERHEKALALAFALFVEGK